MTRRICVLVPLVASLLLCVLSSVVFAVEDIAVLTDANFEHDTQATTGSTTGRWLVLFHNGNDSELRKMLTSPSADSGGEEEEEVPTGSSMVQTLLEEGVVVGIMDYTSNPSTVQRLSVPGAPHAVVLSKGKLYRTNSMEDIQYFAISEYEIATAEEIPPIPSALETLLADPNGKMAVMGVVASLILLVLVVVFRGMTTSAPAAAPAATKKKE
ncbi:expressed unknown protein [Seminavis robusta]|uniref:Uncharacterized protein n=1 Tax=Seminavis robusta TaxID=568900 RepID=A0A9N8HA73_9STRA|nr:expressed unknown protein [Seminavis robusta]|eukprot:Sro138_g064890.1 n/a (213) ;mRNA; r:94702-95468